MIQNTAIHQSIFQALQGSIETDEALQITINNLHLTLEVSCCLLTKLGGQEAQQSELNSCSISQTTTKSNPFTHNPSLQSYFRAQLTQGDLAICDRLSPSSREIQQLLQTSGAYTAIIAPLICHQSYLGELSLYQCDRPRIWTTAELDLVKLTANYVAIALYQTELHNQLDRVTQTEAALRASEERKQTKIELHRREQEFRALVEHSPDVIARFDQNLSHIYVNPAIARTTGFPPDHLIGRTNQEIWGSQETVEMWEIALKEVFSTGLSKTIEFEFSTPLGIKRYQSRLVPEFNCQGKVESVLTICRDISVLKQVELALRQSEEQLRQLAENIGEVFWIASANHSQLIYVSPAFESIWGSSCESLYANPKTWQDSIHSEDRDRILRLLQERSLEEWEAEYRIVRPDRTLRWIRDRAFPIRNEVGEVYRYAGIAEDITQRKQSEQEANLLQTMAQAVLESEDFHSALQVALQKVCEATTWAVGEAWVPDTKRSVLECSPFWYSKVADLTEFRKVSQEFTFPIGVGIPGRVWATRYPEWCRDVSAETSNVYLRAKLALNAGLKAALGIPIVANEQVLAVLVFYMFEAREEDQRLIELISASTELGLFIQRKQAEGEIRKSLLRERELNRLKSNFISMVSHELRTPLSSIILSADLLENYGQQCSEEKKQTYFRRIQNSTKRITQLLENVLLLGQAEAGKLDFNPKPMNLERFCQDLVEELQPDEGSQHSIVYISQGNCELAYMDAYMDEKLLHHILGNLLCNAIKYSPQGGTVRFELSTEAKEAVFKVQDMGIGIPQADQSKLFEPFHRATNVGKISGTGLGLSIAKQCVDLHCGQITVQSEMGVGTTFTVRLPLSQLTGR